MQAGTLRHRGTIEQRVERQVASGAVEWKYKTWAENVPFAIEDVDQSEQFSEQQLLASGTVRLRMRWRPGVTTKMRVKHVTNPTAAVPVIDYYDIQGFVRDPTHRRELTLICMKRDAEGFRSGATN